MFFFFEYFYKFLLKIEETRILKIYFLKKNIPKGSFVTDFGNFTVLNTHLCKYCDYKYSAIAIAVGI